MPTQKQRRAAIRRRKAARFQPVQQRGEPRPIPEGFRRVRIGDLGPQGDAVRHLFSDPSRYCLVEADGSPLNLDFGLTLALSNHAAFIRGFVEIEDTDEAEIELRLSI